jgi:ribosomal peptide maturation radical SAM protein 1
MYRIALINMPFAAFNAPSIALTQLKSALDQRVKGEFSVETFYLNQDFAHYIGVKVYKHLTTSMAHHSSGLGDWFFRQAAFPELPDNTNEYFQRFYSFRNEVNEKFKLVIQGKRRGLDKYFDELITKYKLDQANIVAFTSMFSQNVACAALARKIKNRNPNVVTVMGGANCESPMGQELVKNLKQIDFVFSGPSLVSFPEFVQYQLNQETEKCHSIQGVNSKENIASTQAGCGGNSIGEELDINVLTELDYGEFLKTFERNFADDDSKPVLFFETSRGCWWGAKAHCTFCGLNGATMDYRAMEPEKALKQFRELFKYSNKCSRFEAVDNILPKSYLTDVLPYIETPPDAELFYEVKADLSESDMQVLARARVRSIQPGIEALATSTLKLMKKGTSVFVNLMLLKNCAMYDIYPAWNLLVGFPGEEEEVYRNYIRDMPLLTHLPPPSGAFPVRFDRYSPYFTKAAEYGLNLQPFDFYELTYPFSKESLANLAYYFSDHNFGAKYFTTMSRYIGNIKEQAAMWQARWTHAGQTLLPKLYFKQNGSSNVVYDSRSGEAILHDVGEVGKLALEHLNKPGRIADLAALFSYIPKYDAAKEMASLKERGLVFQENDRFLNLVLSKDPPAMTIR